MDLKGKTQSYLRMAAATAALAIGMIATAASAQNAVPSDEGGLDEIVVTAQRRSENLQDVPISVSAISASALENSGIDASSDLPQIVPSVQMTRSGANGLFFIRGVGTTNGAAGEEGANAFYVDGVYLGDMAQSINYFNSIERIEVLKGPQGTLFGRNATGGLVHIITREPGDERVLEGRIGYANYDTIDARAYLAQPLGAKASLDLALTARQQNDGYGRNVVNGVKAHLQDYQGARSKLVVRPSDAVKLTLSGDYLTSRDNLIVAYRLAPGTVGTGGNVGPSEQNSGTNENPITRQRIWGIGLTGEADLGFATLTSITAMRKSRNRTDALDVDGGRLPLVRIDLVSGNKSLQQELRLASNQTKPFSWQVGAFYYHARATNVSFFSGSAFGTLRGQDIRGRLVTDSYAAFGEATYAITPTTQLTGGIRYTKDKRHFLATQFNILANGTALPGGTVTVPSGQPLAVPGQQDSELSYGEVTWRIALRQEITSDINVYASVNRGFKAGSYSLQNPLNDPYRPQYITAYEGGVKAELFNRRLRLNLSAYHYDISDYQVRSSNIASPAASLVLNAATVKVDGLDLEFEAAPTDELRLFGGLTVLNSHFGRFGGPGVQQQAPISYPIYVPGQTVANSCLPATVGSRDPGTVTGTTPIGGFILCLGDVSGNRTPNAPKLTATAGVSYKVDLGGSGWVRASALFSYNSGYYFESDNKARQGKYGLINSSIEYRPTENLGLEFWVQNLTDKEYSLQQFTAGTGRTEAIAPPRTYGVNLNFSF